MPRFGTSSIRTRWIGTAFSFRRSGVCAGERDQREMARALDRRGEPALVPRAISADPPRDDLVSLGQKDPQRLRILVIEAQVRIDAEPAHLRADEASAAAAALLAARLLDDE